MRYGRNRMFNAYSKRKTYANKLSLKGPRYTHCQYILNYSAQVHI